MRSMMRFASPARLAVAAGAFALLFAGLAARPAAAQTAAKPSPEELVVGLLPYKLGAADIPAGYETGSITANTPALQAFNLSNSASEGQSALKDAVSAGFLTGFVQEIAPKPATPVVVLQYEVDLFTSADSGSSALHDSLNAPSDSMLQADNPPVPVKLGDESGALHLVLTNSSGLTENLELITWRRGAVLFTLTMFVPDATETIDQILPFAQAADAHAATVTPPATVAQATLPVTSSESVRVDASYALYTRLPGTDLTPYGLRPQSRTVISNADLLVDTPDPLGAFTKLVGNTARIVGAERDYATLQGEGNDMIAVQYVLSASKQGAQAELQSPFDGSGEVTTTGVYSLPKPLGDSSGLVEGTAAYKDGGSAAVIAAVWTRGFVTLKVVSFSPSNDVTPAQLNDFAAQVDAFYNRGALPAVLTNPSAPQATPATSPTAPSNPVQSWSSRALTQALATAQR
jgi:hypothetical protein